MAEGVDIVDNPVYLAPVEFSGDVLYSVIYGGLIAILKKLPGALMPAVTLLSVTGYQNAALQVPRAFARFLGESEHG